MVYRKEDWAVKYTEDNAIDWYLQKHGIVRETVCWVDDDFTNRTLAFVIFSCKYTCSRA